MKKGVSIVKRVSKKGPAEPLARSKTGAVTNELMTTLRARAKLPAKSTWVDPDDAPEWTDEMFARADLYRGDKLIRRGRPPLAHPKQPVSLRLDDDVVEKFRATGPGWQTRMNDALRVAAKRLK
jgi:uncharacterized protein (DUF4415 family)